MRSKPPIRISKGSTICIQCGKDKKVGFRQKAFLCNACYLRKNRLVVRRRVLDHYDLYAWLHANKYPDGFQVLCHNCNMAKGFYSRCPHNNYEQN